MFWRRDPRLGSSASKPFVKKAIDDAAQRLGAIVEPHCVKVVLAGDRRLSWPGNYTGSNSITRWRGVSPPIDTVVITSLSR
jgi:hypothetical protein